MGARPQHSYPPALHASSTALPRDLSLKLDQQHSKLRVGESTEVECYSSDDTYSDVMWERADGTPLPPHIQVSKITFSERMTTPIIFSFFKANWQPFGYISCHIRRCGNLCLQMQNGRRRFVYNQL